MLFQGAGKTKGTNWQEGLSPQPAHTGAHRAWLPSANNHLRDQKGQRGRTSGAPVPAPRWAATYRVEEAQRGCGRILTIPQVRQNLCRPLGIRERGSPCGGSGTKREPQRQRGREVDLSAGSSATLFTIEGAHRWALPSVAGRRGSKQQVRPQGTESKGT